MLIHVDKLKRRPRQIILDEAASDFPVLQELIEQEPVTFNETIHGSLEARWAGDVIEVSGSLSTSVTSPCCRCLMQVTTRLDIPVMLCYCGNGGDEEAAVVEELELKSEELGVITFSGPEIDLRPDLEQEVIMALPQRLLCQETCRGLCHGCGCNLNTNHCDCEPPVFHSGLLALKNYKVKQ